MWASILKKAFSWVSGILQQIKPEETVHLHMRTISVLFLTVKLFLLMWHQLAISSEEVTFSTSSSVMLSHYQTLNGCRIQIILWSPAQHSVTWMCLRTERVRDRRWHNVTAKADSVYKINTSTQCFNFSYTYKQTYNHLYFPDQGFTHSHVVYN